MSAVPKINWEHPLRPWKSPVETGKETNKLISDMCKEFGFTSEQVFITEQGEVFFDFDALCAITNALGNFFDIYVEQETWDMVGQWITAKATVVFESGMSRRMFDTVAVGDPKPDGTKVQDMREAMSLARVRAFRAALRAAGFDPIKAFLQSSNNEEVELETGFETPWTKMNGEAHKHGLTLGLIKKVSGSTQLDKSRWYKQMQIFFPNAKTSKDLNEAEMSRWVSTLRALVNAQN